MVKNTYEKHVKEILRNKNVKRKHEKLFPEYELARSIIKQHLRKKMAQGAGRKEDRHAPFAYLSP